MKYAAIGMMILLILALVGVGYLYMTCTVTVDAAGVIAVDAATQPELLDQLREQMASGSVVGTAFSTGELKASDAYQFYTYTVRLTNHCMITADMVEVQVTPMDGDVMQLGDTAPKALGSQATGDIQATILTTKDMHAVRELTVTYYMWGIPFSTKTTYGG